MSTPETIEDTIQALRTHIHEYQTALNDEGIWLFLSTLGCWGVSGKAFQFAALIITIMLFGRRMQGRFSEQTPFRKMIASIRERVESELEEGDSKKARLYELIQIEKVDLSFASAFKEGWVFFVCWGFLITTLAHTVWQ